MATTIGKLVVQISANVAGLVEGTQRANSVLRTLGEGLTGRGAAGQFARILGLVEAIRTAGNLAKGAMQAAVAEGELGAAISERSAGGIMRAQLAVHDAHGQMLQAIPLIGGAIRQAMDVFGDRAPIERAIRNIEEMEKRIEQMHRYAQQLAQETAVKEAEARKASASEIANIRARFDGDDRKRREAEAFDARRMAAQALVDAQERLREEQKRHAVSAAVLNQRGIVSPQADSKLVAAQEQVLILQRSLNDAERDYQQVKRDTQRIAAASTADVERQRLQEFVNDMAEAERQRKDIVDQRKRDEQTVTAFVLDENQKRIAAIHEEANAAREAAGRMQYTPDARATVMGRIDLRERQQLDGERERAARSYEPLATLRALREEAFLFEASERSVQLYKLAKAGASSSEVAEAERIYETLDAMKEQQKAMEETRRLYDETRTPIERLEQTLTRYDELLLDGQMTWDTYSRAVKAAYAEMGAGPQAQRYAGASQFGTTQAYSALVGTGYVSGGQDRVADNTNKTVKQLESSNQHLSRIKQALDDQKTEVVAIG